MGGCGTKKVQVKNKSQGYSMNQFVKDGLVPIWGYAGWVPEDDKRKLQVKGLLESHNKSLREDMLPRDESRPPPPERTGLVSRKDTLPKEIVCVVGLWKAMVDNPLDERRAFDLNQAASVRVKLNGSLNFPPDKVPLHPQENGLQSRPASMEQDTDDNRWFLKIDVVALLSVHEDTGENRDEGRRSSLRSVHTSDTRDDQPRTHMQVRCERLEIWNHVVDVKKEMHGDPMVESWLPKEDILHYIEDMLGEKIRGKVRQIDSLVGSRHFRLQ